MLLTFMLLLVPCFRAMPSPAPIQGDVASFYSSSGFISSPSIYSYTIENQLPSNQTTTIYQSHLQSDTQSQSQKYRQGPTKSDSTNRNLYYTSSNTNSNTNFSGNSRRTSSSSSVLTSTTTSSSSSLPAAVTMEATPPAPISDCTLDRLAVYKVVLHTYWTRELFPKHYPDWRPTAQWTKTLGECFKEFF